VGARLKMVRPALAVALGAVALLLGMQIARAVTVGPATHPIGVIRIPKGALVIGKGYPKFVAEYKKEYGERPIACDAYGECSRFHAAVLQFTPADPKTFGIGKNPTKIWPK